MPDGGAAPAPLPRRPDGPLRAAPADTSAPFALGFRPALDGLRGVSVLTIMVFHTVTYLLPAEHQDLLPGTFLGVDMFFVLSGFLITNLLLEERARTGGISWRGFYARRALRLLPALVALLVSVSAYVAATGLDMAAHLRTSAMIISYTSNWFFGRNAEITDGLGHMWSLAIEEQFYLLWPLVVIGVLRLAPRARHRALVVPLVVGIVGATAVRYLVWESEQIWSRVYFRTDARIDSILIGCLLALACHAGWVRVRPHPWLALAAAGGLVYLFWEISPFGRWYYVGGATLTYGLIALLLFAVLAPTGPVGALLRAGPLRYVGRISYSLYLWHVPVYAAALRYLGDEPLGVRLLVAEAATVALGVASHHLVERPFLRLKHRLAPSADPVSVDPGGLAPGASPA